MENTTFSGQIVDVVAGRVYPGTIEIADGFVISVTEDPGVFGPIILPGLIDAHIHIESSMLVPSEFARLAVIHGTTAVVSDPHEISNVLGIDGIRFMIKNGERVPFNFYFGAPSCVPATSFESAGAVLGPAEVDEILSWPQVKYLSEMMNFPGVLSGDESVIAKLQSAKKYNKPVDGHAPGLKGDDAKIYASAGITTDHECSTADEAEDKIKAGMKILIREGSAAKNFNSLIGLITDYPEMIMFCSDDKHPDDLITGHINLLVKRAISEGHNFMDVIRACTLNPVRHYNLDAGLLQPGDKADFIMVDNPEDFNVMSVYIAGNLVAENGNSFIESVPVVPINNFNAELPLIDDLKVIPGEGKLKVIRAYNGQLMTSQVLMEPKIENGFVVSDIDRDILKLVVLNRYHPKKAAVAFITGFNLKNGAIASTVAHDSHNIIAVGVDDISIINCIEKIIKNTGGISTYTADNNFLLSLPVAGLMSTDDGYKVADQYQLINKALREAGSDLDAPLMTLSFMSLLVIPDLKLSDKGLFDVTTFSFSNLFHK
ncbi:MAG TPA: adenine deaminase [Lentimicrobium sp.]|nr:adenine deaminase [Lentimicrobium sp.]